MWWPFTTEKTYKESDIFHGMTDWHAHILPGVDDGVQNMEDALSVLKNYERLGISRVWLTPHVMEDIPNETSHLREVFEELKQNYAAVKHHDEGAVPVELNLASENMLDSLFAKRIKDNDVLPIGKNHDHLLLETSYVQGPANMDSMIQSTLDAGYYPILAHPERYFYMHTKDYDRYREKYQVKYQMNIPALAGLYGPEPRRKAKKLLEYGFYDFVGTDIHGLRKLFAAITEYKIANKHLKMIKEIIETSASI